jgi:hypothetical protein
MSLEYYDKAHGSIISNMDLEWKLTCLKHFISELCNQKKTSKLVAFDYGDLHQDVLKILYERASRADLRTHDYYTIIYALHIKHKDYIKAAYSMFECAARLKKEVQGINSLKRQERCHLACLNALKLIDKKYAWIPKPNEQEQVRNDFLTASDENAESNSASSELKDEKLNIEIIDLAEINKSYMSCFYMLKLASLIQNQSSIANYYMNDEIIPMLIKFGLFDDALMASRLLKSSSQLPLVNVFVGLVDK